MRLRQDRRNGAHQVIPDAAVEENGLMESWGAFRKDDGTRVRPDVTFPSEGRALKFIDVFVRGRSEFEARKL